MSIGTQIEPPLFQYTELPPGDHIRYLVLQPGQGDEAIQGTLHVSSLQCLPYFEAISYVWGAPDRTRPIFLNGRIVHVTKNLEDALKQVRKPDQSRTIWADALCIDQGNKAEKSVQVAMMGQIYSTANRVLICLGTDPDHVEDAEAAASLVPDLNDWILDTLETVTKWNGFPKLRGDHCILSDERLISLSRLLKQPWFNRGWTVQESVLGREARVLWCYSEISWLQLVRTCAWARGKELTLISEFGLDSVSVIHLVPYLQEYRHDSMAFMTEGIYRTMVAELQFLDVLNQLRRTKVTDPRDQIYAFLGLMVKFCSGVPPIHVDYRRSCAEVYLDVAAGYILSAGNAAVLHYIQHNHSSIESSCFPSWVPRWDIGCEASLVSAYYHMNDIESLAARRSPVIVGTGVVKVRGVIFDRICSVSEKVHGSTTTIHDVLENWNTMSSMQRAETPYKHPDLPPVQAFLETIWSPPRAGLRISNLWEKTSTYAEWIHNHAVLQSATGLHSKPLDGPLDDDSPDRALEMHEDFQTTSVSDGRKLFLTERGYYGSGSQVLRKRDLCCVIFGGTKHPFILRETNTANHYKILGDYHGVSHIVSPSGCLTWLGQAREWEAWGLEEQDIFLC